MKAIRGPLYRLNTSGYEVNLTVSPLGQRVDRTKFLQKSRAPKLRSASRPQTSESTRSHFSKLARQADSGNFLLQGDERLGDLIADWRERGFELCHETCELRYHSNSMALHNRVNESRHVPGMISLGFMQSHTRVCVGEVVETVDRNLETAEKLRLFTIEVMFHADDSVYPKYYVLGHPDVNERDRWLHAMKFIVERKVELQEGWEQFCRNNKVGDQVKAIEWLRFRTGESRPQLNVVARRKARLQNGKVHRDVPIVFARYSEECTAWPNLHVEEGEEDASPYKRVMDVAFLVDALSELGLELAPKSVKRIQEELRKNPPNSDAPGKVDLRRFMLLFRSCVDEFLVSPSAEMKQSLMHIMQGSKNPFLSLLSPAEQMYLIEGQDAEGRYVCACKSYSKDTVLVQQGDDGDSMFVIIEGNLSVVVTFGSGSATIQKEVAVLPAGSVMGEMSLVLGKPRSATCIVKSDTASVAEIAKSAMASLPAPLPRESSYSCRRYCYCSCRRRRRYFYYYY